MESFKEFCEGWVGMKGNVFQRNQLFTDDRLADQYNQIKKAMECNIKRGAVKSE